MRNHAGPIRRVLQIDGGGVKGIIPASVLAALEARLAHRGKTLHDVFDLILGSSTGAILGTAIAAGVSALELKDLYSTQLPRLFRRKFPLFWASGIYDRRPFQAAIRALPVNGRDRVLGDLKLKDFPTRCLLTTYNLATERTHFMKSWEEKDGRLDATEAVSRSALSAVLYFGSIRDPQSQGVYEDGGQGFFGNTLSQMMVELLAQGFDKERGVTVVSLGCGTVDRRTSWKDAVAEDNVFGNLWNYVTNQALKEAVVSQVSAGRYLDRQASWFHFHRFDRPLTEAQDGIDKLKYLPLYTDLGQELAAEVNDELIDQLITD